MPKPKNLKKIDDKIKALKEQIIANAKDAVWMKTNLSRLTSLQKQANIEAVELIVPTKEVKQEIDGGPYLYKKTPRGILFSTKGGLYTFVENRLLSTHSMLENLFVLNDKQNIDETEKQITEAYFSAVAYIMQAPIFASLNDETLFGMAASMLKIFSDYTAAHIDNAALNEETESDIRENEQFSQTAEALHHISNNEVSDVQTDD